MRAELASRPKRETAFFHGITRLCRLRPAASPGNRSSHAAQDKAARAPFSKERRMKFAKASKFHWKSGEPAFQPRSMDSALISKEEPHSWALQPLPDKDP
jgi:hypothetical protein